MDSPPKQIKLILERFPKEPWAKELVEAFNQLSLQTTNALAAAMPQFKTLTFKTGVSLADSFPIDFPVAGPLKDVRIAQVIRGGSAGTPTWSMLSRDRSGTLKARVSVITGLSTNTTYEIKLALE